MTTRQTSVDASSVFTEIDAGNSEDNSDVIATNDISSSSDLDLTEMPGSVKLETGLDLERLRGGVAAIFELAPPCEDDDGFEAMNNGKEDGGKGQRVYGGATLEGQLDLEDEDLDSPIDGDDDFTSCLDEVGILTSDGGVKKIMKKSGAGEPVGDGFEVQFHYSGFILDHDEAFDSSRRRRKPEVAILGRGRLVPGLEIGLSSMRHGEISHFLVAPEYAYGSMGCGSRIPPESTVLFHVHLLSTRALPAPSDAADDDADGESPYSRVSSAVTETGSVAKDKFRLGDFRGALKLFLEAADKLEDCTTADEEEQRHQQDQLFTLYKNAAVACNKLKNNHGVIKFADKALKTLGHYDDAKCLFLCGRANRLIGEFKMAEVYLKRARRRLGNSQIEREMELLKADANKRKLEEKLFYERMIKSSS